MVTFNANHWSHKITSKLDLQLKTVIKRDTNGGRRDIRGKIKKWRHSKKMNGLIIYSEKIPYLQSSSQYLIQRENHGYFSYNICKALNMLWIYRHSRVFKNTYHCISRSLSETLFIMPDICTLFLQLYYSSFAWFFSR